MKKLSLIASLCFLLACFAQAQKFDPAFGLSGLKADSASSAANSATYSPQAVSGGVFPSFSGDFLFSKLNVGINANVAWRGGQGNYQQLFFGNNVPYRPIFYTFNGIIAPRIGKRITAELYGGLGGESVRFYQGNYTCSFTGCTNYTSSNHFLGDIGGGLRLYILHRLFLRPEVQVYFVRNNFEFSGAVATRAGVSIGYTFGSEP